MKHLMKFERQVRFAGVLLVSVAVMCKASLAASLLNTPVYDPSSKSYFELVDGSHMIKGYGSNEGPKWDEAFNFAKARVYKGVNGRLAIVESAQTHFFLQQTFHPDSPSWIGLRLWCARRILVWSDRQNLKPAAFQAWDAHWSHDPYTCNGAGPSASGLKIFAPVAYSSIADGFRWIAVGASKRFYYFFVQYPTGHP